MASSASLDECFAHTDLKWRLAQVPLETTCRGAFFNMLDDRAGALSTEVQAEYRRFFKIHRFSSFRMYPVTDYLTRLVVLAQVQYGARGIYAGIRELQSTAFDAWAETLLGKAALAVVDPGLGAMLRMLERAYASNTVVTGTRMRVTRESATEIITEIDNEYVYIEHAMVGAAEGIARVCGTPVHVTASLTTPFSGVMRLQLLGANDPAGPP